MSPYDGFYSTNSTQYTLSHVINIHFNIILPTTLSSLPLNFLDYKTVCIAYSSHVLFYMLHPLVLIALILYKERGKNRP